MKTDETIIGTDGVRYVLVETDTGDCEQCCFYEQCDKDGKDTPIEDHKCSPLNLVWKVFGTRKKRISKSE